MEWATQRKSTIDRRSLYPEVSVSHWLVFGCRVPSLRDISSKQHAIDGHSRRGSPRVDDGMCLSHCPVRRNDPLKGKSKWSISKLSKNKSGRVVPNVLLEYYLHVFALKWRCVVYVRACLQSFRMLYHGQTATARRFVEG